MKRRLVPLCLAVLSIGALAVPTSAVNPSRTGNHVKDFTLDNCYGKKITMSEATEGKLTAIVFLGTECPLAKLYGPRLSTLQEQFKDDVAFIGVCSNRQDSISDLAAYVHRYEINFPMLKDVGNRVADQMSASRTPEVFVLDQDHVVRYHGRIDDQYGVGYAREQTNEKFLADALQKLIDGKEVSKPDSDVVGCIIGRVSEVAPTGHITYTKDIAPIFNQRCVSCHREGQIAPFALTQYDEVLGWEDMILEVIDEGRMPPWFADPEHGDFKNTDPMTEDEKRLVASWVDNGMPEGDPEDMPAPPVFADGWRIEEPHQVVSMSEPFKVPAEGVIEYQKFDIDPGWDEDRYITAAEIRPGARSVVHHVICYVITPDMKPGQPLLDMLALFGPGMPPVDLDEGKALFVPAGSKLKLDLHYTAVGTEQLDQTSVGFRFCDKEDVREIQRNGAAMNTNILIPAGASNHSEEAFYYSSKDEYLVSMTPHTHLRGVGFKYDAIFPDGREQTLLNIPKYDFNWQITYRLTDPLLMPKGTRVKCTAWYDNSIDNPNNPDPTRDVPWGDQTFDEMIVGFVAVSSQKED